MSVFEGSAHAALRGATGWLNSEPLTPDGSAGMSSS